MKGLIGILVFIAALLLTTSLAAILKEDPGQVIVRFQNYEVETSLLFSTISLLALFFIFWLALKIWLMPWLLAKKIGQRQQQKLETEGYLALQEGDWSRSEKLLSKAGKKSEIHYLAAARAAQKQLADDRCNEYLALADQNKKHRFSVDLTRAEALLESGKTDDAIQLLNQLRKKRPGHPQILRLLLATFEKQGDWRAIQDLSRSLKRRGILSDEGLHSLQSRLLTASLYEAHDAESLQSAWNQLNKPQKTSLALIQAYTTRATELGLTQEAEKLISKQLKSEWNDQLVRLFGLINDDHVKRRLKLAEQWLQSHPEDPSLLQALGRMCMADGLWGKARDYFEAALHRDETPETYRLLGELAEEWNADDIALTCYRNALLKQSGEPVRTLPTWPALAPAQAGSSAQLPHNSETGLPELTDKP